MFNELLKLTQFDLRAYYRNCFAQFLDALHVILGINKDFFETASVDFIFY
jgi:hypothetical protein